MANSRIQLFELLKTVLGVEFNFSEFPNSSNESDLCINHYLEMLIAVGCSSKKGQTRLQRRVLCLIILQQKELFLSLFAVIRYRN